LLSFADRLYDQWPKHWTGTEFALCGLARVDGKPLRFMGGPEVLADSVQQISVEVSPRAPYTSSKPARSNWR